MYRIDDEQRRSRLGRRHLLAASGRSDSVVAVADALVALHATDAATLHLSVCARLSEPGAAVVERALYDEVTLVRLLSMRNTLFTVSTDLAPLVDAANARAVAAKERHRLLKHLREDGNGLDGRWLARTEAETLTALAARGRATGSELSAAVPALRTKITVFPGTRQETVQGVASRVIRLLAADGRIRRDRPRGSWTSSQFRWTAAEPWPASEPAAARAEIARRWLYSYGPATEGDLKWWTGWGVRDTRAALTAAGAKEVLLDSGAVGLVAPGDHVPEPPPEPWAGLLPGLDPARWAGPTAASTCPPDTVPRSSTGRATSARRCGGTARSWADGPSARTVSWCGASCPTWGPKPPGSSRRRRSVCRPGWARPGSPPASAPRWNAS